MVILSFRGYLGEIELVFPNCLDLHMHYCATVSASNFQVLICSGSRASTLGSFIRFLAGPARTILFFLKAPRNTLLKAPLNIALLLHTLFDPTPRRH